MGRRVRFSVLATSIIAMVLQLLVSSAHIHGLDGDTYHHGYAQSETNASFLVSHAVHRDKGHEAGRATVGAYVGHDGHVDAEHQPPSDGGHEQQQACDFCWLFGALASLNTPTATALIKPIIAKAIVPPHAVAELHESVNARANRARAPPTTT